MIYLVDIESIPTRYTCEWKEHVPELLRNYFEVTVIEGDTEIPEMTTPGAFLNFGGTNMYKATQTHKMSQLIVEGKVNDDDIFLFTDAWHPGIINLKYMLSLLNIKAQIHGLWHAGSYDPQDFLGRYIGDKKWIRSFEYSLFNAIDFNWVATSSHEDQIKEVFPDVIVKRTGWPMGYTRNLFDDFRSVQKENIIIYPHRLAPEKRVDLFKELAKRPELSHYTFMIPMEMDLSKREYHELLAKSKFAVSFAEQETLGISMYEATCAGAIPLVPNRLSYREMYYGGLKHDGTVDDVVEMILDYEQLNLDDIISSQASTLHNHFFTPQELLRHLKERE